MTGLYLWRYLPIQGLAVGELIDISRDAAMALHRKGGVELVLLDLFTQATNFMWPIQVQRASAFRILHGNSSHL